MFIGSLSVYYAILKTQLGCNGEVSCIYDAHHELATLQITLGKESDFGKACLVRKESLKALYRELQQRVFCQ